MRRDIHASQQAETRARLAELRQTIARLQGDKREAAAEVRAGCAIARQALPARLRLYREAERARLKRELAEARQAARNRCQAAKLRAKQKAGASLGAARVTLAETRKTARAIREAERKVHRAARLRSSSTERRTESDDEVTGNLPAELVPIFQRVKRTIHGGPRRSRTEAFVEWAEENAGVVAEMRAELAEREFGRLLREHQAEERATQRAAQASRRRPPTAAELAAVPF